MSFLSVKGVVAGLLVVVIAGVCVRLGFWQLNRLEERRATNEKLAAAMAAPVLPLDSDAVAAVATDPESFRFRRVRASGEYDESGTSLLRGRARQGSPGVHLITPLRLERGAGIVLVDRGWLPAADATTADPRPYRRPGTVTLEGMIRRLPPTSESGSRPLTTRFDDLAIPTFQRLDLESYRSHYGPELLPFYIERSGAGVTPGGPPFGAPPPALDEGPHLGYALQWFSFAAIALIGFGVVVARSRRPG